MGDIILQDDRREVCLQHPYLDQGNVGDLGSRFLIRPAAWPAICLVVVVGCQTRYCSNNYKGPN